jgi:hypothetical protein
MKIPKMQDDRVALTIRLPQNVHAELVAAAHYNGRFVNDEVLERIKSVTIVELLHSLMRENAEMKAMIKEMHDLASGQ